GPTCRKDREAASRSGTGRTGHLTDRRLAPMEAGGGHGVSPFGGKLAGLALTAIGIRSGWGPGGASLPVSRRPKRSFPRSVATFERRASRPAGFGHRPRFPAPRLPYLPPRLSGSPFASDQIPGEEEPTRLLGQH